MVQTPFNPVDKKNVAASVTDAMLSQSVAPLPPEDGFSLDVATGKALYKRLAEHAASIVQAKHLNLEITLGCSTSRKNMGGKTPR